MKIAFVGAGNMGGAVARRLATGGHEVHVFDLNPEAVQRCADAGAKAAASAGEAAAGAAYVFTSLPLPEHVRRVWTELAPGLAPGAVAVDVSTIDPPTAEHLTRLLDGHEFVHCALGKTPAAAEEGAIPLFVGGPADAIEAMRPLLERIGEQVYDFGSPAAASMFKLVSNMIGMTNVAVLAEGYVLARRAGIEDEMFSAALRDTGAFSFQSDVRLPWIVARDYAPRFGAALAAKDVRLAVDSAARWNVPTPVAAQALSQLVSAVAHGYGGEDVVAVHKLLAPGEEE
ncbi:NAD(P)-dependent oxidoreductase [Amycolatopsis acidicola]|uniref:NAD(P)-dependent oxidoreductase n=1 Tax=Amycolatopsis acidicola TaxID=2596893 RepID=A0A5N0UJL0_9PSEU|nr:NAD(P)-dependent oxidoreductase [Amycolatopsis acidicola]KAA9149436.1 NAD(P)-dependent oxidoreductase [Amycolatopsis acidicola]